LVDELSVVEHPEYRGALNSDDADFAYLLLMTGLRADEARTLRWADVNFSEGLFIAQNTKNRMKHTLPMTGGVEMLLRKRLEQVGNVSPWVFPSRIDPTKCSSMSRTFERLQRATGLIFTAHDLRRTVATVASEMGYDLERIGAMLNHKKSGVTSRYIQTTIDSLRETLQSVEDMVLRSFEIPNKQ
jgi:integrase